MSARVSVLAALLLMGCYSNRAIERSAVAPGMHVVLELTDQGAVDIAPAFGAGIVTVEGILDAWRTDSVAMQVIKVVKRDGQEEFWKRNAVRFPASVFGHVAERRFDRRRSWLAGAGIVAGAILIARSLGFLPGSGSSAPDPGTVVPN